MDFYLKEMFAMFSKTEGYKYSGTQKGNRRKRQKAEEHFTK